MGVGLLIDASLNGGNRFFSHHRFPFLRHASILSACFFTGSVLLETGPTSLSFVSMLLLKDNAQLQGLSGGWEPPSWV